MIWCTTQLDALQQSPLYHLSLGSKELFHSNFLAWAFCEFGDSAFDAIQNHFGLQLGRVADPRKNVSREHLNLDLAVEFDNGLLLVIENKVKSLPDRSQLERYGAKVKKKRPQGRVLFVLLSAMDPSFDLTSLDEGDTTWSHWSYRDISKIMREVVRTTKSGSPYTRALLADYADFAETLDGLCKRTAETTQADFLKLLTPETANELTGAHIHDLVYKLAFQHRGGPQISDNMLRWLPIL
jgi:hypothetical protein